ncbi:hypothetical protein SALBM311S_06374 [Streptomyces alboniger]
MSTGSGWRQPGSPPSRTCCVGPPSTVPEGPRSGAWQAGAGRQGLHTEPFGRMLAEMQHLHRSHPGASW